MITIYIYTLVGRLEAVARDRLSSPSYPQRRALYYNIYMYVYVYTYTYIYIYIMVAKKREQVVGRLEAVARDRDIVESELSSKVNALLYIYIYIYKRLNDNYIYIYIYIRWWEGSKPWRAIAL